MPGFLGEITNKNVLGNFGKNRDNSLLIESIKSSDFFVERRTIKKFINDKVFLENEKYLICTEGVILNSLVLKEKYTKHSFFETCIEMYERNGEDFFKEFRGSFSGFFYDKKKNKWLIWTNHIGDKQVFYYKDDTVCLFASEMTWISDYMNNNNIKYSFDVNAAYMLLNYAFMLEDFTHIKEIRKLLPGWYIKIDNGVFSLNQYWKLSNVPNENIKEDEAIEKLDELFRKAVKLEYDKDLEYGYKHFGALSGGLDSRMNIWVAHELGYTEQLNETFCQTGYYDEKIAGKIAADLKHDWLFKALDNGNYLFDIDKVTDIMFGNVYYPMLAHWHYFLETFDSEKYGLHHSGQLGDAVLGSYLKVPRIENSKDKNGLGSYSHSTLEKIDCFSFIDKYENDELFKFYQRGFNGILLSNLGFQDKTEVVSPFLDIEFLEYALSIPPKYRYYEEIYHKWIIKKYPKAADYVWEKTRRKITETKVHLFGKVAPFSRIPALAFEKVFKKLLLKNKKRINIMNPFEYWYATNDSLKNYMDAYFSNNIDLLSDYSELKKDVINVWIGGGYYNRKASNSYHSQHGKKIFFKKLSINEVIA